LTVARIVLAFEDSEQEFAGEKVKYEDLTTTQHTFGFTIAADKKQAITDALRKAIKEHRE